MEQKVMDIKDDCRYSKLCCLILWLSVFLLAMVLTNTGLVGANLLTRPTSVNTTIIKPTNITITTAITPNATDTFINATTTINTIINSTINTNIPISNSDIDFNTTTTTIKTDTTINTTNTNTIFNLVINTTSGLLTMSDMCPGVDYLYNQTNVTVQEVNVQDCKEDSLPDFTSGQGVVHGMCGGYTAYCRVYIEVPHHMFARVTLHRLAFWCEPSLWKTCLHANFYISTWWCIECGTHTLQDVVFELFTRHVILTHINLPAINVIIEAIKEHGFIARYASEHSGYILLPARDKYTENSFDTRFSEELKPPFGWVIMISFQLFMYKAFYCDTCTELIYTEPNTDNKTVVHWCSEKDKSPRVFTVSHLYIEILVALYDICEYTQKMLFSFHPVTDQPTKLTSGQFNCSVDHYSSFQHHLDCNLKTQCEDGQDEREHCPFSSPDCQGLVASRNKCFLYVAISTRLNWREQQRICSQMGGQAASIKTREEQRDFCQLFKTFYTFTVHVGCRSGWASGPVMYSKFRKWSDNTMIYNLNHFITEEPYSPSRLVVDIVVTAMTVLYCLRQCHIADGIVCETQTPVESRTAVLSVQFPESSKLLSIFTHTSQDLWACLHGHMTHAFLSCDASSRCGNIVYPQYCALLDMEGYIKTMTDHHRRAFPYTIAMFECDDDLTTLPYTLVCDFQHDCPDNSDESFCEHPVCNGFLCSNAQCIVNSQHCNGHSDCLDNSDEDGCTEVKLDSFSHREADKTTNIIISFDGAGFFTQQVMKSDEPCPNTHYRCTDNQLCCLPVYTRCNGFSDCTYGEDEQDCERATYSGFYQCRASRVCVHEDHLCDGWGQCPQRDDEWRCDMTCPDDCLCQGHSALCSRPFPAYLFPHLRYVDATRSGMTLANFSTSPDLIYLSLSRCSLVDIADVQTVNLLFIDLSNNHLKTVNMNTFLQMWNLRILILTNNPLSSLVCIEFTVHYTFRMIDLSRTHLGIFNHKLNMYLPKLCCLNLSFSAITTIRSTGFKTTPQLTELDLRGSPVNNYHLNLWSGSSCLKAIFTSNFRFCCTILFPEQAGKRTCTSPQPMFSSCTNLLPAELHRLFFVLNSVCAVLGNVVCAIVLFLKQNTFERNFTVFLLLFQVAKMCMGINTTTITIAHGVSSGKYIFFEKIWINSLACKMAGFLSLLSSEVSVLIIWFMTLDHIIVLCCPLTRCKLDQYSTAVVCGVIWSLGILLSVTPFLPGLSHWGVDDQSGLCRLALFDCYSCHKQFRWFTVIAIFNFILHSVIVVGQGIICRRTPKYRILLDPNKRSMYSSTQLLVKLAVTDAMCWFCLALKMLVTSNNGDAPDKTHVAVVVFILPLSSSLNPFLYMWSVVTQQRKERQEENVLQLLKSRLSFSIKHLM